MYSLVFKTKIKNDEIKVSDLIFTIYSELEKHKPSRISIIDNSIQFKAGMFRGVTNWNLLVTITSGIINFDEESSSLVYKLSFKQLILFGIFASISFGLFSLSNNAASSIVSMFIMFQLMVWLWLVGMNFLICVMRFRSFIEKCIKKSGYEIID